MNEVKNTVTQALYNELEEISATRERAEITYKTRDGNTIELVARIERVSEIEGVPHLLLDNGLNIRVDSLVRLNGRDLVNWV